MARHVALLFFAGGSWLGSRRSSVVRADPLGLLTQIKGTYTHPVDDTMSVSVSYDLENESNLPTSVIRRVSLTKTQEISLEGDKINPGARVSVTGAYLPAERAPAGSLIVETEDRLAGVDVNGASQQAHFHFGRGFLDDRLRFVLSPVATYSRLRHRRINFAHWVPRHRPLGAGGGLPSMYLDQADLRCDWTQSFPPNSRMEGVGVSLSLRTGAGGGLTCRVLDGRPTRRGSGGGGGSNRLWSWRADIPLEDPLDVRFTVERTYQVLWRGGGG